VPDSDPDPVESLRAVLRRGHRRHRLLTLAALLLAALSAGYALHVARHVRVVEARGFVVCDDRGEPVATLGVVEVAPGLKKPELHLRSDGTGSIEVVAPRGTH
jgi:hypothetical protein